MYIYVCVILLSISWTFPIAVIDSISFFKLESTVENIQELNAH